MLDEDKKKIVDNNLQAIQTWPLAEVREGKAMMRKARDEAISLAQEEALFENDYYSKRRGKTCEEKQELDKALTQRELLMLRVIRVKGLFNSMKAGYKEDLAEQWEEWKKFKKQISQIEEKEWFKSLMPEQKEACIAELWRQAFLLLSLQNKMLERWGDELSHITLSLNTDCIYKKPLS